MSTQSHLHSVPRPARFDLEGPDEAVLLLDELGRIVVAAGAVEPVFGSLGASLVGTALRDLFGPGGPPAYSATRHVCAVGSVRAANDNFAPPDELRAVA
jgi:hypothetical protein